MKKSLALVVVVSATSPSQSAGQLIPIPEASPFSVELKIEVVVAGETGDTIEIDSLTSKRLAFFPVGIDDWCDDGLTICESRFLRARLTLEPDFGILFQSGTNKFAESGLKAFSGLVAIGVEYPVFGGLVAAQYRRFLPGEVGIDLGSPLITQLSDPDGSAEVASGWSIGGTLLNGIVAVGYGRLNYTQESFMAGAQPIPTDLGDGFVFVNLQLLSTGELIFKALAR